MPTIGNIANACWKGITCSDSLPSPSQQEPPPAPPSSPVLYEDVMTLNYNYNNEYGGGNSNDDYYDNGENDFYDDEDPLLWSNELERHSCGQFSHAMVQSNHEMRTYTQVEVGSNGMFVGTYDGHVGHYAAEYLSNNLITDLITNIKEKGKFTGEALERAIQASEDGFLYQVHSNQHMDRRMVITGSSCLVGVIWKEEICIAHVGISRAVNGRTNEFNPDKVIPVKMTDEHDINNPSTRQDVINQHLHDPYFVVAHDPGKYLIKGITEIARSIGDAYLKREDFKVARSIRNFQLSSPLIEPGLSSQPTIRSRPIEAADKFFIFASRGFWEHIKSHRAVTFVSNNPRKGVARRLIMAAQRVAARKANITYNDLVEIPKGYRREIHDDMSVIVVFVDHDLVGVKDDKMKLRSFKGFYNSEEAQPSSALMEIDELM